MERAFASGWAGTRERKQIRTTTRSIYEYYRLRDLTPFGDADPIRLRLGGPDKVSIKFIGELDHFYFSKFADNTREPMRKFFVERFFGDGALLFDEDSDAWREFQRAAGDRFKKLGYRQIRTVIETATARTRNWAHIGTMAQAEIELAKLVATLDARTTPLCEFLDGKLVKVGVAQSTIERLNQLAPAEFERALYKTELSKGIANNPVDTIRRYLEEDGRTIGDELTKTGRGFPPFHPNCRTRMEGVIEGLEDE